MILFWYAAENVTVLSRGKYYFRLNKTTTIRHEHIKITSKQTQNQNNSGYTGMHFPLLVGIIYDNPLLVPGGGNL